MCEKVCASESVWTQEVICMMVTASFNMHVIAEGGEACLQVLKTGLMMHMCVFYASVKMIKITSTCT